MKQTLLALLALATVAVSCQKELSTPFQPETETPASIWASLEAQQPPPQLFTRNLATPTAIAGHKGTLVKFPANAFVTPSGAPVTGNVTIELKELYEVWEMILHNKFTQVGTMPIESGGQFLIRATQNGQELKLAPGATLEASLPTNNALPRMQVFTGSTFDSAGTSLFSWALASNQAANNVSIGLDSAALQAYIMKFDTVGWINCDRFIDEPMHQTAIQVTNLLDGEQASVLVHFTGMKSVMQLYNAGGTFKGQVPTRAATFIAASSRNGQLYAAFLPAQLQAGQTFAIELQPMTEEEFGERIRSLD